MLESEEQEIKGLLEEEDTKRPLGKRTDHSLTKYREYLLLGVLLFSQFVALCTDTFLFPFFPQEAKSKGLSHVETGTVFSSFEFARFVTAPVLGYLVIFMFTYCSYFMVSPYFNLKAISNILDLLTSYMNKLLPCYKKNFVCVNVHAFTIVELMQLLLS